MRFFLSQPFLLFVIWPALLGAQSRPAAEPRTTISGVYSRDQARRGQDVYFGQCRSCHTPEAHAGDAFQAVWRGRPLADLYGYLRERMPKSEPGALSDQDYVDVLSYMLRLNRMPDGDLDLPADSVTLKAIRFETPAIPVRKAP